MRSFGAKILLCATAAAAVEGMTCSEKCYAAGHCCQGVGSSCANPSCAQACTVAPQLTSEAQCNATCDAAANITSHIARPEGAWARGADFGEQWARTLSPDLCSYKVPNTNITFSMCGGCPAQPAPSWFPKSAVPPVGQYPSYWPPGYSLSACGSCETIDGSKAGECKLGCVFAFRPDVQPVPPPKPVPPAPRPAPPACGPLFDCTTGVGLNFSTVFSDHAVLQRDTAAVVYGPLGTAATAGAAVEVMVSGSGSTDYTVKAVVDTTAGTWKATLKSAAAGGSYTIKANCLQGCTGSVTLRDVTFGDVWYCNGQSNMALPFRFTYARNATISAIRGGKVGDIRVTGLKGNMNDDQEWIRTLDAVGGNANMTMPGYGEIALDQFSSTCLYFGIELQKGLNAKEQVPIGLVHTAWGGSSIEEWLTKEDIAQCKGAGIGDYDTDLYDSAVRPYLDMRLKGWVWYQGENNCGRIHGNSGTATQPASGYACLMPKLVSRFRTEWGLPDAAFGLVSLSSHDSEGAADMASFRWAQQASYGTVPNPLMPNTFLAHAFDLQDPWNGNTGACLTNPQALPGFDCTTPWYMGPSIHPRLKQPVGARLALGALQTAYGIGSGVRGGSLKGCAAGAGEVTLKFDVGSRQLNVRSYNASRPELSAVSVRVNTTQGLSWMPVPIRVGDAGSVVADLSGLAPDAAGTVSAVRYAWGDNTQTSDHAPNGNDVSCCEGDGTDAPCVPGQCPIHVVEAAAPYGMLPVDPFLAEIVGGKCLCPEPQECSA